MCWKQVECVHHISHHVLHIAGALTSFTTYDFFLSSWLLQFTFVWYFWLDLAQLQCVQNQLARLVTKSPPFTRSIPLLRSLHWLPVRFRILFKNHLLTYKTLCEKQPVYLHSMFATSISSHSLRSNNDNSLWVPRVKTNTGARAFHSCAPSLWNNLPLSVRSATSVAIFKKYLKTHLFDLAFPP